MFNPWYMVVRPNRGRDLADYFSWLSNTRVKRYRAHYRRTSGHLYLSVAVQELYCAEGCVAADSAAVCGGQSVAGQAGGSGTGVVVVEPQVQLSFDRGRPPGSGPWTAKMAAKLGVQYLLNPRGGPTLTLEKTGERWISP